MADQPTTRDNVVAVQFEQGSSAYEALTRLNELDSQDQFRLHAAAVVIREDDGHVVVKEEVGDDYYTGVTAGGILGLLIGVIGGPLGVLLGGATGLLAGSLFDLDDEGHKASVLSDLSSSVLPGKPALLAEVSEQTPEVLDTAMSQLGGTVLRRHVEDVEAEIALAEEVQQKAKEKAREQLHEKRKAEHKHKVQAKIQQLKGKLHHREPAGSTAS